MNRRDAIRAGIFGLATSLVAVGCKDERKKKEEKPVGAPYYGSGWDELRDELSKNVEGQSLASILKGSKGSIGYEIPMDEPATEKVTTVGWKPSPENDLTKKEIVDFQISHTTPKHEYFSHDKLEVYREFWIPKITFDVKYKDGTFARFDNASPHELNCGIYELRDYLRNIPIQISFKPFNFGLREIRNDNYGA